MLPWTAAFRKLFATTPEVCEPCRTAVDSQGVAGLSLLTSGAVQHELRSTVPLAALHIQGHDTHVSELELGAAVANGSGAALAAEEGGRKRSSRCAAHACCSFFQLR